jgi:hypothetical protein
VAVAKIKNLSTSENEVTDLRPCASGVGFIIWEEVSSSKRECQEAQNDTSKLRPINVNFRALHCQRVDCNHAVPC